MYRIWFLALGLVSCLQYYVKIKLLKNLINGITKLIIDNKF